MSIYVYIKHWIHWRAIRAFCRVNSGDCDYTRWQWFDLQWTNVCACVYVKSNDETTTEREKQAKENEKQQIMLTSNSCIRLQIQLHRVFGWGPLRWLSIQTLIAAAAAAVNQNTANMYYFRPLLSVHHTCIITKTFRLHTRSELKLIRKIAIVCTFIRVRALHRLDVRFSCWH